MGHGSGDSSQGYKLLFSFFVILPLAKEGRTSAWWQSTSTSPWTMEPQLQVMALSPCDVGVIYKPRKGESVICIAPGKAAVTEHSSREQEKVSCTVS